jgi:hypothetical protein
VSGGTSGTHSGLRATINAWLEDISFRTGMITGAVVLLVIAAAGAAVAILGHGSQAASALGSRATATPATVAAPSAQPSAAPRSAVPATGSGPAAAVAAASGASRESYGLASPDGWRHGFPRGWGGRRWVWGPYRGGPHFGGPRW